MSRLTRRNSTLLMSKDKRPRSLKNNIIDSRVPQLISKILAHLEGVSILVNKSNLMDRDMESEYLLMEENMLLLRDRDMVRDM